MTLGYLFIMTYLEIYLIHNESFHIRTLWTATRFLITLYFRRFITIFNRWKAGEHSVQAKLVFLLRFGFYWILLQNYWSLWHLHIRFVPHLLVMSLESKTHLWSNWFDQTILILLNNRKFVTCHVLSVDVVSKIKIDKENWSKLLANWITDLKGYVYF